MNVNTPVARVRIVVRSHERPLLLARALDDALAQSFRDWELVLINHQGDPELIESALAARAGMFPSPVRVIHSDHPIGRDAILGLGVSGAETEYTAVHDDDDTWSPLFLERTVAWLDAHPDDLAVAVPTDIIQERIGEGQVVELHRESIRPPFSRISLFDLIHSAHVPPIGILFRRSAIDSAGGFDDTLSVLGDWDLLLRLATRGSIGYLEGPTLAYWRQRPHSDGALANSVIGDLDLHRRTDRELRDRALRDYVSRNGIGGLLYTARFVDEQFAVARHEAWVHAKEIESTLRSQIDDQTARLDKLMAEYAHHYSLFPSLRRALRRALPHRRRSRRP